MGNMHNKIGIKCITSYYFFYFFFLIHVGCPGQLTRTTTIPHGPLDILQAQEQVRHRGGDRRAHRGSNPGGGAEQVHDGPQQLNPQVLGTHEGSNQGTQAVQSLPRPLSYKIWIRPHKDRYKKKN